jgi:hypothetical protein
MRSSYSWRYSQSEKDHLKKYTPEEGTPFVRSKALESGEFVLRANREVVLAGLDRVDVNTILGYVFGLSRHHGVHIAKKHMGSSPSKSRAVSCFMYISFSLDTGPVHDISAYLYQLALGSISSPQLIGVQV